MPCHIRATTDGYLGSGAVIGGTEKERLIRSDARSPWSRFRLDFLDADGVRGSNPLPPTTKAHTREHSRGETGDNANREGGTGRGSQHCQEGRRLVLVRPLHELQGGAVEKWHPVEGLGTTSPLEESHIHELGCDLGGLIRRDIPERRE